MRFSSGFRAALVALFALASAGVSSAAHADSGTIWITELKGGWFVGASGGGGGEVAPNSWLGAWA